MIPTLRRQYNETFTNEAYRAMLDWMGGQYGERPQFHVAETPVFVPAELKRSVLEACSEIIEVIRQPDFAERARPAIPPGEFVHGQNEHPLFFQLDFGLCRAEDGSILPQLVEGQGFPSLYFFQLLLNRSYRRFFTIPDGYRSQFGERTEEEYVSILREAIIGGHDPKHVVLLEVDPNTQKTRIDFTVCCAELGIEEVCISDVELAGRDLYYYKDGVRTPIKRIFNRVIFDEFKQRPELHWSFNMVEEADVEWAGHPNWFFLFSKYSLPFMNSRYVPDTQFVSELKRVPDDLDQYVLKPLYSFAGAGVDLNPTREKIEVLANPPTIFCSEK